MDELDAVFPRSHDYEIISFDGEFGGNCSIFSSKIRVNLSSAADIKNWIQNLGESLRCNFILKNSTTPKKVIFRKYFCNLSRVNKVSTIATPSSAPNLVQRNYDCKASVSIWIRSGDDYSLRKLAGEVLINWNHSHEVENAHFLSLLRPLGNTKTKFFNFFDNGMTPPEAIKANRSSFDLISSSDAERQRANKGYNPSNKTVYYWYDLWREENFGQRLHSFDALSRKTTKFTENGVINRLNENPFAVLIVTPIMQRVHQLASSSEISFVDSTATCDVEDHSVTFMLARCCIGAAPLAIFITSDQTERSYVAAFGLLRDAMGNSAFGKCSFLMF